MGLAGTTTSSSILHVKMSKKKQQTQDHPLCIHQFALLNWNSRKKRILLSNSLIFFFKIDFLQNGLIDLLT